MAWLLASAGCEGVAGGALLPTEQPDAATEAPMGDAGAKGEVDAGPRVDAGGADAGSGVDAGSADAGSTADAGSMVDGGGGTAVLVVVGYGARRARTLDGTTWTDFQQVTASGGDDDNLLRGVGFGGGVFVAVGGSTKGFSLTSRDGVTWANENRAASAWIGNVGYLNGQFVAAGGNGLRMRSLDSGKTWVDEAGYQGIHYRDLVVGKGLAVAVGHSYAGVGQVTTTPDGVHWTSRVSTGESLNSVAFGNGVFVAVGSTGRLASSADGVTWADVTSVSATQGNAVVFTGAEFIATLGSQVLRSTDGVSWASLGASRGVDGYAFGKALSLGWPASIASSTDYAHWATVFNPQGSGLTRFALGVVSGP